MSGYRIREWHYSFGSGSWHTTVKHGDRFATFATRHSAAAFARYSGIEVFDVVEVKCRPNMLDRTYSELIEEAS